MATRPTTTNQTPAPGPPIARAFLSAPLVRAVFPLCSFRFAPRSFPECPPRLLFPPPRGVLPPPRPPPRDSPRITLPPLPRSGPNFFSDELCSADDRRFGLPPDMRSYDEAEFNRVSLRGCHTKQEYWLAYVHVQIYNDKGTHVSLKHSAPTLDEIIIVSFTSSTLQLSLQILPRLTLSSSLILAKQLRTFV